jgi:hypothetical protein
MNTLQAAGQALIAGQQGRNQLTHALAAGIRRLGAIIFGGIATVLSKAPASDTYCGLGGRRGVKAPASGSIPLELGRLCVDDDGSSRETASEVGFSVPVSVSAISAAVNSIASTAWAR